MTFTGILKYMMMIEKIAEKTLPPEGHACRSLFWELLKGNPAEKDMRKIQSENSELPLKGLYLIYTLGKARPVCKGCGAKTSFHSRDGNSWFSRFCGSQCANSDSEKKSLGSKSLAATLALEKNSVAELLKAHKQFPRTTTLNSKQISYFSQLLVKQSGQPREYDLLQDMSETYRSLWARLPATTSRGRLLMATGQVTLTAQCKCCGVFLNATKSLWFYGWSAYCSSKCSGIDTVPLRITPDAQKKSKATYAKILAEQDIEWNIQNLDKPARTKGQALGARMAQAIFDKHGVSSPTLIPEFRYKQLAAGVAKKPYQLGNRLVYVQGYEPYALDLILKKYAPDDVFVEYDQKVPVIDYEAFGRKRKYYPDVFIPKDNRIVEVKSLRTLLLNEQTWELNKAKRKSVIASGYKFNLMLLDKKHQRINLPRNLWKLSYAEVVAVFKGYASV